MLKYLILLFALSFTALEAKASDQEKPKICLTLLVRDNEKVLHECLTSAKGLVDCFCICDASSTDRSVAIAEAFLRETKMPGKVYKHKWQDFAHNREMAAMSAQAVLKDCGFSQKSSYLLILDGDKLVKQNGDFDKGQLQEEAYALLERSNSLSCSSYQMCLLKASAPLKAEGVVYDYRTTNGQSGKLFKSLVVEEIGDEADLKLKLSKNAELLSDALKKTPGNARLQFWLAKVWQSLEKFDKAIDLYEKRSAQPEEREEVWFSKWMLGECFEKIGKWDLALYWYLEAYQAHPERADPLHKIALYYRYHSENDLAYIFAKYGARISSKVEDQLLFGDDPVSSYHFDHELSISAFYTRYKEEGATAANDLILRKGVPWYFKEQAARNMIYYIKNIHAERFMPVALDLPLVREGYEDCYNPMNPSIEKTEGGYRLICRSVNFTQKGAANYHTVEEGGIYRTKNFLLEYDRNFRLLSQQEIVERLPRKQNRTSCIEGLEDCRLFRFQDRDWFTCTTTDTSPIGTFQISLCALSNDRSDEILQVEKLIPLKGPDPRRCEKNWLPFVKDNAFHAIYSYEPLIVYKPNLETGDCQTVACNQNSCDFSRFRGSAGPLPFDDGYLVLVHEVAQLPDNTRCYYHRFLFLDRLFNVIKLSNLFTFQHSGVEFCCGMCIDHAEKKLVMPIGIEDHDAYLCFVDLDHLRTLLRPLPIYAN